MSNPSIDSPDPTRSQLRVVMAALERHVGALPAARNEADDATHESLRAAFRELVALLALGPEPEMRTCPSCGRRGMSQATTCGFCWVKLNPV